MTSRHPIAPMTENKFCPLKLVEKAPLKWCWTFSHEFWLEFHFRGVTHSLEMPGSQVSCWQVTRASWSFVLFLPGLGESNGIEVGHKSEVVFSMIWLHHLCQQLQESLWRRDTSIPSSSKLVNQEFPCGWWWRKSYSMIWNFGVYCLVWIAWLTRLSSACTRGERHLSEVNLASPFKIAYKLVHGVTKVLSPSFFFFPYTVLLEFVQTLCDLHGPSSTWIEPLKLAQSFFHYSSPF